MHLFTRNVNSAFRDLVSIFNDPEETAPGACKYPDTYLVSSISRQRYSNPNGTGYTLRCDEPVMVTYGKPRERVLFNAARDANPFFHLYEALWMLAGRNDVAPLRYYCSKIAQYSDDGDTFNGAYGYRWRHAGTTWSEADGAGGRIDQLDILVEHLKAEPTSRRAILSMWNVEDDLLKIGGGTAYKGEGGDKSYMGFKDTGSKDVCCNLNVKFKLREHHTGIHRLDMTVFNRSNDLILGMLGANYVHFSFLQEYMAARLGVEVGVYNHITDDLHVYEDNWKPAEWLGVIEKWKDFTTMEYPGPLVSLVQDPAVFEKELPLFVELHSKPNDDRCNWSEPFFKNVAEPMMLAFHCHKGKHPDEWAMPRVSSIAADDWRLAASQWLQRRTK